MKKWIIGFVVFAHLAGLTWFLINRNHSAADVAPPVEQAPVPQQPPPPPPELTMATLRLTPATGVKPMPAKLASEAAKNCRNAIIVDLDSRSVIWEKNADQAVPIASMTKMMTALLAMEAIYQEKRIDLTTLVPVTSSAAKIGGSQVWLDTRESFTVEELLKCVMIKSANDASELLGQFIGGDSATFVASMNQRAKELGCAGMTFYNAHGLPPTPGTDGNLATPREMVLLAARLLEYPKLMEISAITMDYLPRKFETDPKKQRTELFNHNTLMSRMKCPGVDGLKTGLTDKAGFCLTATCLRNNRRIITVVTGCPTGKIRDQLVAHLLDWAYQQPSGTPPSNAVAKPPPAGSL